MKRIKQYYLFACIFIFSTVSNSLSAATPVDFDVATNIKPLFSTAGTQLKDFVIVILGVLAVLWVGRKFIKTSNKS